MDRLLDLGRLFEVERRLAIMVKGKMTRFCGRQKFRKNIQGKIDTFHNFFFFFRSPTRHLE